MNSSGRWAGESHYGEQNQFFEPRRGGFRARQCRRYTVRCALAGHLLAAAREGRESCRRSVSSTRRASRARNRTDPHRGPGPRKCDFAHRVRGIALTPTEGLARGNAVVDTGGQLQAPVGKGILSRMFDVFGNAIDRQAAPADVQWRTVHRAPPPLARRSTKSEIFETGIKVIDVLVPLERGGKAGLFGGAGVGKTVL